MTSMLLTASSGSAAAGSSAVVSVIASEPKFSTRLLRRSAPRNDNLALLAGIGRQVLFGGVFLGRRLDHRAHQLLIGFDPVGDELPGLAVPLMDPGAARPGVVLAAYLDRAKQPLEAKLRQLVGRQVKSFQAPADLLAGHRLVAELALGGAHRLDREQRIDHAAVVQHGADILPVGGAHVFVVEMLEHV